jgi:hypothetical protein
MTSNQEGLAEGHLSAYEQENRELRAEVEHLRQHDHEATNMTIDQAQEIGRLRAALTGFVRWVEDLGDTMSPQTRALYDKAREALAQEASPTDACT